MKVIFLDMDGVLCTAKAVAGAGATGLWRHLDPVNTKLVERLAEEANAQIVLSSTWRIHFDQDAMTMILCNAGFSSVPWHNTWCTPKSFNRSRGKEIESWLSDNPVDGYCILDDDEDVTAEQRPFFVKTDELDGLSYRNWEQARVILGVG